MSPYRVRLTTQDVIKSRHFKLEGESRKEPISAELDIKNKVLSDKRRALIQILKDKRPLYQNPEPLPSAGSKRNENEDLAGS